MTAIEAMDVVMTPWRRFVGANIKGTPAMPADKVAEDVEVLKGIASIVVTQEVRWVWYWRQIRRVLDILPRAKRRDPAKWRSIPGIATAIARPVKAASGVLFKGRHWRKLDVKARRLHDGEAGISENREIRAGLLGDWETGLAVWGGTCHFVVGGDMPTDSPRRRRILDHDLDVLDRFLDDLVATGHPILFQLDANIRPASGAAYRRLRRIIHDHGGRIIGDHGVEFLFVIDGRDTDVEVRDIRRGGFTIKPKHRGGRLNTDHEARGITFRLVRGRR